MEDNQKKAKEVDLKPIQAFSFMVEVISHPDKGKLFIARVSGANGMAVGCMGNMDEFIKFVRDL